MMFQRDPNYGRKRYNLILLMEERNTAEILDSDDTLDDLELSESGGLDRTLVLKAEPRSRRAQLIAQGA